jgi:C-terminal processing protease CtpA/Prc
MESCFSSDAANISFKTKKVEQQFAFHYQTVFGATETFKIKFQINGKQEKIKQISALSFSAIKENRKKRSQSFPRLQSLFIQPSFLDLSIDSAEKTALLTIKTFEDDVLAEAGTAFNSFVDSAFIKIERAGVSSLIIDIRSNEGGTSAHASYLYSYLTNRPFSFLNYMEASRKTFLEDVKQGIAYAYNSESNNFRTRDSSAAIKRPRFYGLSCETPKSNSFSGKVLVLINGLTTSSASQFASLVKRNKRGLLVGEEAPGPLYGGSGREYIVFKLPNTGMVAVISKYRIGFEDLEDKKRDTSIFPDYQTTYSIQDRLHGVDEELKQAYQLLNDKKYYPEQ